MKNENSLLDHIEGLETGAWLILAELSEIETATQI